MTERPYDIVEVILIGLILIENVTKTALTYRLALSLKHTKNKVSIDWIWSLSPQL
jgi:hypothetical protein